MRFAANRGLPASRPVPLSSAVGAIRRALFEYPRTGLLLDYDGTLAPIVQDPTTARMSTSAREALSRLARQLSVVGVVSGRELDDLAERASAPGIWLAGSHGAVIRRPSGQEERATVSPEMLRQLPQLPVDLSDMIGVRREIKTSAVAFHYRGLESDRSLVEELRRRVSVESRNAGLTLGEGRCVFEARVPGIDKGAALRRIVDVADLRVVVVVGDDWTDLDAFRAAHDHATCEGIAIAVNSSEIPVPLQAVADVLAVDVAEVENWLRSLA